MLTLNPPYRSAHGFSSPISTGKYTDLTSGWYAVVGVQVASSIFNMPWTYLSSLAEVAKQWLAWHDVKLCPTRRSELWRENASPAGIAAKLVGPEFDIPDRMSQVFSAIFVS